MIRIVAAGFFTCSFMWMANIFADEVTFSKPAAESFNENVHQTYVDFFHQIYETMDKNYYFPIKRENFERFIEKFNGEIYPKLKDTTERNDYVAWRSSSLLVDLLKDPEDKFSAFMPPKAADKFEQEALGQKIDLGIEGKFLKDEGYLVTRVEPRSDAYLKGLKADDIIRKIDNLNVLTLTEKEIQELLTPFIDTQVLLTYWDHIDKAEKMMEVMSQEYFRQSVFMVPVDIPGVYCLEIRSFNRKTSEDMFHYLSLIEKEGMKSLILDLRGNPGGPPLAAREIAAFFLSPDEELAYFEKKGERKVMLTVPKIPEEYRYTGPLAILVNEESGSASELFSGVLQKRRRAVLIGKNTAGKVLLKSMFHFDDGSMLLLVTARGFFPDGKVFDFDGLKPDYLIDDKNADLIQFAANYLTQNMSANPNRN